MSAGFGLAGCAAIDDLKSAISQWFETPKVADGREVSPRGAGGDRYHLAADKTGASQDIKENG
jgi:hypothetical protein